MTDGSGAPASDLPLAVTAGDPAGIGLEITLKAWAQRQARNLPAFVVVGPYEAIQTLSHVLGLAIPVISVRSYSEGQSAFAAALPVIDVPLAIKAKPGTPESANGAAVISAIERAVRAVRLGEARAVVTNPISKYVLHSAGFKHPGHTEFLGTLAATFPAKSPVRPVMMLASDLLKVVPLTIHIPLRDVPGSISENLIVETARIVASSLTRDFGIASPRIAIAGLNPHAGENGSIGTEDATMIKPAIVRLLNEGLRVTGPHPADTLFHAAARTTYDAVIAMYHDQALIPIKTLAFDTGVNVTLGLPFVRTSPDHGTAFDIAPHGRASAASLIAAIKLAETIAARREIAIS